MAGTPTGKGHRAGPRRAGTSSDAKCPPISVLRDRPAFPAPQYSIGGSAFRHRPESPPLSGSTPPGDIDPLRKSRSTAPGRRGPDTFKPRRTNGPSGGRSMPSQKNQLGRRALPVIPRIGVRAAAPASSSSLMQRIWAWMGSDPVPVCKLEGSGASVDKLRARRDIPPNKFLSSAEREHLIPLLTGATPRYGHGPTRVTTPPAWRRSTQIMAFPPDYHAPLSSPPIPSPYFVPF
ncbi:unnamed protein product [Boreogadus saida]